MIVNVFPPIPPAPHRLAHFTKLFWIDAIRVPVVRTRLAQEMTRRKKRRKEYVFAFTTGNGLFGVGHSGVRSHFCRTTCYALVFSVWKICLNLELSFAISLDEHRSRIYQTECFITKQHDSVSQMHAVVPLPHKPILYAIR